MTTTIQKDNIHTMVSALEKVQSKNISKLELSDKITAMQKLSESTNSTARLIKSMEKLKPLSNGDIVKSLTITNSFNSMPNMNALRYLNTTNSIANSFRKLSKNSNNLKVSNSHYSDIIKEMNKTSFAMSKVFEKITIKRLAMLNLSSMTKDLEKLSIFSQPTSTQRFGKLLTELNTYTNSITEVPNEIEVIDKNTLRIDNKQITLNEILDTINILVEAVNNQTDKIEDGFEQVIAKSTKTYSQEIINFIFIVIYSYAISIAGNLTTPLYGNPFQVDKKTTTKDSINTALLIYSNEELTNNRIVTGHDLYVRVTGYDRAEIVDILDKGRMVTLIKKNKAWSNIRYCNSDGIDVDGWVFSRYLTKIKK